MKQMPKNINWDKLSEFEKGVDTTSGSKELACTAGVCEVVDIVAISTFSRRVSSVSSSLTTTSDRLQN